MADQVPARVYLSFALTINDATMAMLLSECAAWANKGVQEIYLLMASSGGGTAAAINAYNVLRSLPAKLVTHNTGNIDSAGNVLFLAGEERYAAPHATFMFHGVAFNFTSGFDADRRLLLTKLDTIDADTKKMASIIKDRGNFENLAEVTALFEQQATKEAEYALAKGLIREVRPAKIPKGTPLLVFKAT